MQLESIHVDLIDSITLEVYSVADHTNKKGSKAF